MGADHTHIHWIDLTAEPWGLAALAGIALIVFSVTWRRQVTRASALATRLETIVGQTGIGSVTDRLARGIEAVEQRLEPARRADQRHSLTGLPTREPLISAMARDRRGLLGVVGVGDFDRLCAFDPTLGEGVLLSIVDRFARMLPPERLVAHVDRANLAIWFGPDVDTAAAQGELDVIGYALSDAIVVGGRKILPEIRIRQAALMDDGGTPQNLLARALASLTLDGSAAAVGAGPTIDPAAVASDRYGLEQDLRQAITRDQLQLHYQPLVDAATGRVCGAEALIRWVHPARGNIPPSRFVPIMEAGGMAHPVGMWILNVACREARRWHGEGLAGLRVAVNVSGHQLQRDDLPALVDRALARHSLGPDALEMELTESVAMGDGDHAAHLFQQLRAMGVRIAIDDFGTGYSSFSTLRTLSFDKIKIDREFITNVDTRRDSQAICQSIIALGRGLGIKVLAEGVEHRGEYEWLRRHGCTHFQGYYFAPPLDGAAFVAFARNGENLARLLAVDGPATIDRLTKRLTA